MKMSQLKKAALAALSLGVLSACAPKSPDLVSPPKADPNAKPMALPVSAQVPYTPKVDILFVIDTSESMDVHQERLKANIDRFVEAFKKNEALDFHIGVVSVWDSIRFGKVVPAPYPLGKLRPLKDPSQPGVAIEGAQYVTRSESYTEILGESLKIGVEYRIKPGTTDQDGGGPQFEESFSPVLPALSEMNGDFYRKDAHLAVIMITDADDWKSSALQASELHSRLVALKDGKAKMVSAYAALALKDCHVDPDFRNADGSLVPVEKIPEFVALSGGKVMNLCDADFGDELASIGQMIEEKASPPLQLWLGDKPEAGTLKVSFNGKDLPKNSGAWSFNMVFNKIEINTSHPEFASGSGGQIGVEYVPMDLERIVHGQIVTIGN